MPPALLVFLSTGNLPRIVCTISWACGSGWQPLCHMWKPQSPTCWKLTLLKSPKPTSHPVWSLCTSYWGKDTRTAPLIPPPVAWCQTCQRSDTQLAKMCLVGVSLELILLVVTFLCWQNSTKSKRAVSSNAECISIMFVLASDFSLNKRETFIDYG